MIEFLSNRLLYKYIENGASIKRNRIHVSSTSGKETTALILDLDDAVEYETVCYITVQNRTKHYAIQQNGITLTTTQSQIFWSIHCIMYCTL